MNHYSISIFSNKNIRFLINGSIFTSSVFSIAAEKPKPNIVILIADDISMNDFSCYGHPVIKTPNIDALAQDGVRFTNTYLCTSSSSPSRASIITGRYPHNTGACELHYPFGEEQITIAELLKKSGYYTAQAGKWHFGKSAGKPEGPALRGFDRTGGSSIDGGGESGSRKFVSYLKERPKDKPFFMWFASHDAHRPWDTETSLNRPWDIDSALSRYNPDSVIVPSFFVNNQITREDIAFYYYKVTRFDYYVGKVIAELKAEGVYDNTFIVIMADNGRPFPRYKTRLIPEGLKTPFVVHYPAAVKQKGSVCNSLVSVIDLAPTLSEIAEIPLSPTFQGKSFLSLLSNPQEKFRNYVFGEHNWHDFESLERMVCNGKYLLIENKRPNLNAEGAQDIMSGGTGLSLLKGHNEGSLSKEQDDIFKVPRPVFELYDLSKDKYQINNLANKNKKLLDQMLVVLRQWQNETGDSYPTEITPDWYSRETLEKNKNFGIRKEMPGTVNNAKIITKRGPF